MRLLIALTLLAISTVVSATTLSWEPPTTRVDGKALDISELSHYNLYCGDLGIVAEIPASTSTGEYEVPKLELFPDYGMYSCHMTAVDTEGLESMPSNTVDIFWDPVNPSSPTNLLIIL